MALSQHDLLRLMESLRTADGIVMARLNRCPPAEVADLLGLRLRGASADVRPPCSACSRTNRCAGPRTRRRVFPATWWTACACRFLKAGR